MAIDVKRIDWDEVRSDIEGQIENEECFANGSVGYDAIMHAENIERLEEFLQCIDDEDYQTLIDYYGTEYFNAYSKDSDKE